MNLSELSHTQRAAAVTLELATGRPVRPADVALRYGITNSGAHRLLDRISGAIPIVKDEGVYRLLTPRDGHRAP